MVFGKKTQKGDTGKYFATFHQDEIEKTTKDMFMTKDGGLHTYNGQIGDDYVSNEHDYSGDKNSYLAMQWKDSLKKQSKLEMASKQQEQDIAVFQSLQSQGKVVLSMDSARTSMNNSTLQSYGKETTEKINQKEEGYVVAPKKEETVDGILNDNTGKWDEVYKNKNINIVEPTKEELSLEGFGISD